MLLCTPQGGANTMMCKSCKLTMISDSKYCPLCNIVTSDSPEHKEQDYLVQKLIYPIYEVEKKKRVSTTVSFMSISASILCGFINIFTFHGYPLLWSLIVASCILCAHKSVFNWVSSIKNSGSKIVTQFFLLSQLVLVIDIIIGYTGWALAFVIPWFSMATTLVITIVALSNKKNYTEYTGQLMAAFFVSSILALLAIFPFSIQKWALLAALLYSLFTALALYMFSKPQFKNEIKKRFKL